MTIGSRSTGKALRAFVGGLLVCGMLAAESSAVAAPPTGCAPLPGAEPWIRGGAVVLLGEIHGTVEAPAMAAAWSCHALAAGLEVVVGLEIPETEQARIDRFVAQGSDAARAELLAGAFFARDYQDGRSSRAMLELIEELGRRVRAGARLGVVALDAKEGERERDRTMATRLDAALRARPEAFAVALAGNYHTRLVAGAPWNPSYRPFGLELGELRPATAIASFELVHPEGEAWICSSARAEECGVARLGGTGEEGVRVEPFGPAPAGTAPRATTGRLHVGAIHASPPATGPRAG